MNTRKTVKASAGRAARSSGKARELPEAYYRVHALWVTTRALAEHEDELCTLMHEIKRGGDLNEELRGELETLLEEMPAEECARNVAEVRASLQPPSKKPAAPGAKPPAKSKARGSR